MGQEPAIYPNILTGYVGGCVGAQEANQLSDVLRFSETPRQLVLREEALHWRRHRPFQRWRPDQTWADCVASDPAVPVLSGHVKGEGVDRPLGARVSGWEHVTRHRGSRTHVDDRAATALEQDGQRVLTHEHRPSRVNREHRVPYLDGHGENVEIAGKPLARSIVVHDVDPTEGLHGEVDQSLYLRLVGDVHLECDSL